VLFEGRTALLRLLGILGLLGKVLGTWLFFRIRKGRRK
jgi:hypothetical protein